MKKLMQKAKGRVEMRSEQLANLLNLPGDKGSSSRSENPSRLENPSISKDTSQKNMKSRTNSQARSIKEVSNFRSHSSTSFINLPTVARGEDPEASLAVFNTLRKKTLKKQPTVQEKSDGEDGLAAEEAVSVVEVPEDAEEDYSRAKRGAIIRSRYILLNLLGSGTFGQVYRALDTLTERYVALKIIKKPRVFLDQSLIEDAMINYVNERDLYDQFHVLQVLDCFMVGGHFCIVSEALSKSLFDSLENRNFRGFSISQVVSFAKQMLECLEFLARPAVNVIHCDLKPENVLFVNSPELEKLTAIKIVDFGASCKNGSEIFNYIQSRFYRAPEVILGLHSDIAIDMWSLGCILVELLTGQPLFPGSDEPEQMALIVQALGLPPDDLISEGYKNPIFFLRNEAKGGAWMLRDDLFDRTIEPASRDIAVYIEQAANLQHTITGEKESAMLAEFIQLVEMMLVYRASDRISPTVALAQALFEADDDENDDESMITESATPNCSGDGTDSVENDPLSNENDEDSFGKSLRSAHPVLITGDTENASRDNDYDLSTDDEDGDFRDSAYSRPKKRKSTVSNSTADGSQQALSSNIFRKSSIANIRSPEPRIPDLIKHGRRAIDQCVLTPPHWRSPKWFQRYMGPPVNEGSNMFFHCSTQFKPSYCLDDKRERQYAGLVIKNPEGYGMNFDGSRLALSRLRCKRSQGLIRDFESYSFDHCVVPQLPVLKPASRDIVPRPPVRLASKSGIFKKHGNPWEDSSSIGHLPVAQSLFQDRPSRVRPSLPTESKSQSNPRSVGDGSRRSSPNPLPRKVSRSNIFDKPNILRMSSVEKTSEQNSRPSSRERSTQGSMVSVDSKVSLPPASPQGSHLSHSSHDDGDATAADQRQRLLKLGRSPKRRGEKSFRSPSIMSPVREVSVVALFDPNAEDVLELESGDELRNDPLDTRSPISPSENFEDADPGTLPHAKTSVKLTSEEIQLDSTRPQSGVSAPSEKHVQLDSKRPASAGVNYDDDEHFKAAKSKNTVLKRIPEAASGMPRNLSAISPKSPNVSGYGSASNEPKMQRKKASFKVQSSGAPLWDRNDSKKNRLESGSNDSRDRSPSRNSKKNTPASEATQWSRNNSQNDASKKISMTSMPGASAGIVMNAARDTFVRGRSSSRKPEKRSFADESLQTNTGGSRNDSTRKLFSLASNKEVPQDVARDNARDPSPRTRSTSRNRQTMASLAESRPWSRDSSQNDSSKKLGSTGSKRASIDIPTGAPRDEFARDDSGKTRNPATSKPAATPGPDELPQVGEGVSRDEPTKLRQMGSKQSKSTPEGTTKKEEEPKQQTTVTASLSGALNPAKLMRMTTSKQQQPPTVPAKKEVKKNMSGGTLDERLLPSMRQATSAQPTTNPPKKESRSLFEGQSKLFNTAGGISEKEYLTTIRQAGSAPYRPEQDDRLMRGPMSGAKSAAMSGAMKSMPKTTDALDSEGKERVRKRDALNPFRKAKTTGTGKKNPGHNP